jgi:hypothetical protein
MKVMVLPDMTESLLRLSPLHGPPDSRIPRQRWHRLQLVAVIGSVGTKILAS